MEEKENTSTNAHYLQAILNNDRKGIEALYREILPSIQSWVVKNNGSPDDAKDVLQDSLIVVFEKASQPDFQLTSTFKTYITSICRFVWLRKIKKKDNQTITFSDDGRLKEDAKIEETLLEEDRRALFKKYFDQLGKECQTVLTLFFAGKKMKEIAEQMGYVEKFAKVKKHLCKKTLFKKIQKDKKYKELVSD